MSQISKDAQELEAEEALFGFLSEVFMQIPDEDFVASMRNLDWSASDLKGCGLIAKYLESTEMRDQEETSLDLGRDRAGLVRNMGFAAIEPPYECLYLHAHEEVSIGALNRFYASSGYARSKDAKSPSDYIGVEFAFLQLLCNNELEARQQGDLAKAQKCAEDRNSFERKHIGRWAHEYARVMYDAAQTDFYRGIAMLILETPFNEGKLDKIA